MEGKIKVVWLCNFSDEKTRNHIRFSHFYFKNLISYMFLMPAPQRVDYGIWVSNAIREFEKYKDIDLTVIFPYTGIKGKSQLFDINGIHYICYRTEEDNLIDYIRRRFFGFVKTNWDENRKVIKEFISRLSPDIIHVIGAENPYYSIAALDVPDDIPSIVTLQTLMSDPDFLANYPISKVSYEYHSGLEKQVIRKCRYIGTRVERFRSIVRSQIKNDAEFLNISLAVGVDIDEHVCEKEFDFVYFAADISKACDYAIEAFAIASEKHHGLTLNISGSYTSDYKAKIDERLRELGIQKQVFFTGSKPTHEDVIKQIKKSRFAILPLKIDLISGTIREAMACGLPVVTTVTPATPNLNVERESVLLSQKGDFQAMANNMLRLLEDDNFAAIIKKNAVITVRERYSNELCMQSWCQAYHEIYENMKNGTPLSLEIKNN